MIERFYEIFRFSYEIEFYNVGDFINKLWDEPSMSEGHQFAVSVKTMDGLQGLRVGERPLGLAVHSGSSRQSGSESCWGLTLAFDVGP